MMICPECTEDQGDNFRPGRRRCRLCESAARRIRYALDPECYRSKSRANRQYRRESVLATNREYRKRNPDRARAWSNRARRKSNGWEPGRWEKALREQGGLCAVPNCERPTEVADLGDSAPRAEGLAAYLRQHCGAMVVAGVSHLDYTDLNAGPAAVIR